MQAKLNNLAIYSSNELKKLKHNSQKYHEVLKQFLQRFKVYECKQQSKHNLELCFYYHDQSDHRRNPYLNHEFLYNIFEMCNCNQQQCPRVHNQYESLYHPLAYKINQCQKQNNCDLGLFCYGIHMDDLNHFQYGQFFRFNLRTFKTEKCFKKGQHQRKTCLYYHNEKDKRRASNIQYSHVYCSKQKCNNQMCDQSHNKLQQLYHANRYKTKFCQFYPQNIDKCDYKNFCSFAHTQNEITENIELIHLLEKNTDFYIFKFKTVWCPFTLNHQRDKCPYAHNFQDYRRNPETVDYEAVRCEYWNFSDQIKSFQGSGCKFGMNCKKCHGWMEQRYHPSKYNGKRSKSLKKEEIGLTQTIVHKKLNDLNLLNEPYKVKGKNLFNPTVIKNNYSKGTPFFKHDKYSQYSAKTKARSNNMQSDKSIDGSSTKQQIKINQIQAPIQKPSVLVDRQYSQLADLPNQKEQYEIVSKVWKEIQQNSDQLSNRSKSAQKSEEYCATYSDSIKNALGDEAILTKLKKQKFNEIQIVNMDQKKIDKLAFLNVDERKRLHKQLNSYNLKQTNSISYSKELTRFFVLKKKQGILEKMQQKKVKETKLLKLMDKEIRELSFLEADQKNILPKLLNDFSCNIQFEQLKIRIDEQTKIKKK